MKIEESKPDYLQKRKLEKEEALLKLEKKRKREERWNNSEGFHAKDMSLVTDNNVNTKVGKWKRGRYGRAIAVMRLKKADGTKFVFDPTNYKNNLEKLYNIGVRMKESKQLPMFFEEYKDTVKYSNNNNDDDSKDYDFFDQHKLSTLDHDIGIEDDYNSNHNNKDTSVNITTNSENKGEERRLAAMERRLKEKEDKLNLINQSEKGTHVTFDDDDNIKYDDDDDQLHKIKQQQQQDGDDIENNLSIHQSQPKDGTKWMFDSDSDDNEELNIEINPVLEGEKGRKRLELQSTFKGDERFKFTEAFMDDDEDEDDNIINTKQNQMINDDIKKSLDEEKDQSMNVLRAMFGDIKVMTQTKPSSDWSIGARYDPEAEDADDYIIKPKNNDIPNNEDDDLMGDDDDDEYNSEDNENEGLPTLKRTETEMPVVSTDKHFSVNVNLKPLFGAEEEPFKLFGGASEDEDDDKPTTPKMTFNTLEEESSSFIPKNTEVK
ncbi:unnamed protein product [Cunninghamella blakesleeana]